MVAGWLGRITTVLHCTHHVLTHRLKVLSFFSFLHFFSFCLFILCDVHVIVVTSGEQHCVGLALATFIIDLKGAIASALGLLPACQELFGAESHPLGDGEEVTQDRSYVVVFLEAVLQSLKHGDTSVRRQAIKDLNDLGSPLSLGLWGCNRDVTVGHICPWSTPRELPLHVQPYSSNGATM